MKDWKEFLDFADTLEAKRRREIMAETLLQQYLNDKGKLAPEDILNAAYTSTMGAVQIYLQQYHEWITEQ